jgi:autotransporter-associated beta strand protein
LVIDTATGGAQGGGNLAVSNAVLNVNASSGTALAAGNLTLQGTNVLSFAPSPSAADSSSSCISLSGALSNTGTNYVNVSGIGLSVGVYHLITAASGTVSTNNFVLTAIPPGAQGMLTNSTPTTLDFVVTSIGQVLSWFGNPSSTPAPWDIGITADWTPDHGGSLTTYNEYFTNTMGDLVTFGVDGANTTDTNYVDLETAVVPASVTFNWVYPYVLTGAGSIGGITSLVVTDAPAVYLGTSNSYTGGTFVYGGSLTITNDNALGASSGGVTLGSDSFGASTLQLNGVTSARNINLVGNSSIGVASNTASVLSGNISGSGTLTKSDYGALTLSGNITNTGSLDFLTGTGAISGTVSVGGELWAGASSDSNNFGVLNIQPGANVMVGSWLAIGRGGYGILNVNGGTLIKGGDNNTHLTMTGAGSGETGILNLNSGLIQDATGDCWLGEQFTSIVNQNGGILANTGGSVYLGRYATANSTYNLNGGLLQTRSVIGNFVAVSNAVFNFNGGTLQPVADSSAFMQGLTAAYVTANGAIIDTTNFNITIPQALADDPINGPGRLVKLGTGVLTLSGFNTISGPVVVNQGTLFVTPADQGTNAVTVADGAAYGVQLTGGPGSVTNAAITLSSGATTLAFNLGANGNPNVPLIVCGALTNNGTLSVALGANSSLLTVGSAIPLVKYSGAMAGAGSMNSTIAGPRGSSITLSNDTSGQTLYAVINALGGGIVWTGTNSTTGLTNLWDLNSTTNWLFGALPTDYQETIPPGDAVVFNDAGSGTVLLSNTVNPTSVTISNSAVNYTFQGTGQINSLGGLTKVGSGTATLNLPGTYSISTVVSNGTLSLGASQNFANLTGDGTISTASGSPTLTENSSADTTFSGALQGGLGLTKIGAGSLTLSGSSINSGGTLVNAGTLNVSGTVGQTGSSAITTVGGASSNATLTISGTMNQKNFFVGNASGAVGAAYQSAGTVTATNGGGDNLCVGNISGGFGYYHLSGGTVLANGLAVGGENNSGTGFSGTGGNGVLDITGGFLNDIGWVVAARGGAAESGVINVFNGALAYAGGGIQNCWGGPNQVAIINILGGTVTNSTDVGFNLNRTGNAGNVGILNLNGGLAQANGISGSSGQLNFGGGTLRASKATGTFINGLGSASVYGGGGTIDNNGFNITVPQTLLAPTGSGVSISSFAPGGSGYIAPPIVTVTNSTGSGATAIAQIDPASGVITNVIITCPGVGYTGTPALSYSGGGGTGTPTVGLTTTANVSGGMTFQGAGTTTLTGANTYTGNTVVGNGTLLVNGSLAGAATVNGGTLGGIGTIGGSLTVNSGATLAPGSGGSGTLTINGNLALNAGSTSAFNINGTTSANTSVAANAAATYGGVLNIVSSGTFAMGQTFTLFSGAGAASASNFASITGSPGAGLAFSFTNGVLSVVAGGPSGPASLTNSYDAGTHTLSLSWPANQGWRLQMQTNSLSIGLSNNWTYVTDGSSSSTNITVDPTQPTVFYRLRYP